MKTIQFKNEKGNVIPATRTAVANQVMPLLQAALEDKFGEDRVYINAEGGGFSIGVATDSQSGEMVFVRLDKVVTTKQPDWKTAPKAKKAKETTAADKDVIEALFE